MAVYLFYVPQWIVLTFLFFYWSFPSRESWEDRAGPCWLLTLRIIGTQGVHMKGAFPWLVCWAPCAGTRNFYPAMAALVRPSTNIFSSPYTFSLYLSPSPSELAGQAVVPCRLSFNDCLWFQQRQLQVWASLNFLILLVGQTLFCCIVRSWVGGGV